MWAARPLKGRLNREKRGSVRRDRSCSPVEARHPQRLACLLAGRIARNAPLAVAASKRLIRASSGCTEAEFWELQRPEIPGVFESDDAKEGPRAFAEKRAPNWSGR